MNTDTMVQHFDTLEKWVDFLEMSSHIDRVKRLALKKLNSCLENYYKKNLPQEWKYELVAECHSMWYLKNFDSRRSFRITFRENEFSIGVFSFYKKEAEIVRKLIRSDKYLPLIGSEAIERIDELRGDALFVETIHCLAVSEKKLSKDEFYWFAYYMAEEVAQELIKKVNRLISNPVFSKLIYELNEEIEQELKI